MKTTYQESREHISKSPGNYAIYNHNAYGHDINGELMVKTEQGEWILFEPTEAMINGNWYFNEKDYERSEKDCSNCKYEKGRFHQCEIKIKAMEYISLEEKVKFCCNLHGYKEE